MVAADFKSLTTDNSILQIHSRVESSSLKSKWKSVTLAIRLRLKSWSKQKDARCLAMLVRGVKKQNIFKLIALTTTARD